MGKPRVIAETGAGQHGVATATACALLGLECVVYMGSTDIERQAPNVRRMDLLGAEVRPVATGNGTLRDALNEALRDWVANVESTVYILGSAAGPHPYPEMVASLQEVIGREARVQLADGDRARAGCGGRLRRRRQQRDRHHAAVPGHGRPADRRRGGRPGRRAGRQRRLARPRRAGRPARRLHVLTQDAAGQVVEPHSVSAGLDYPGVGPQLAALAESGRLEVVRATDAEALEATQWLARTCGIIPALESAHADRRGPRHAPRAASPTRTCSSTSRAAATRTSASWSASWPVRERRRAHPRLVRVRAAAEGRTAFIAYILSGYPSETDALAAAEAALAAGADMLEIGVPFSDPMADGPTIAEAGRVALAAGGGLASARAARRGRCANVATTQPLMVMSYLNPLLAAGESATLRSLRTQARTA